MKACLNVFVYGTLLRGQQNTLAIRLANEAEFLGEAVCPGKLFKIDWYPGLVPSSDGSLVHGDLFALPPNTELWTALDAYEGVGEGFDKPYEYERALTKVMLANEETEAWVYFYNWDVSGKPLIKSGRFAQENAP
ncbi:MAG: gamma-glutamylcyclotransferase family protein [Pseudomonadota bacterium]|nr:gamma-glutamylcyclotransferase family protein [Pseudomonadota bacterium]